MLPYYFRQRESVFHHAAFLQPAQEVWHASGLLPFAKRQRREGAALMLRMWPEQPGFWHQRFYRAMRAEKVEGGADFRMGERTPRRPNQRW